jgi:hypothetical protein
MVNSLAAALVAVSALAASTVSTDSGSLQWQADYGKALAATRDQERPLLVVLDVPDDPKSALEAEQLKTKGKQGKLLSAYELCHVDVSTKYGKKVAEAFRAKDFPFTAIIDRTGSIVLAKQSGPISNDEWLETLAKYQEGERKSITFTTSFYRGGSSEIDTTVASPVSGCKSCQLRLQQQQAAQEVAESAD